MSVDVSVDASKLKLGTVWGVRGRSAELGWVHGQSLQDMPYRRYRRRRRRVIPRFPHRVSYSRPSRDSGGSAGRSHISDAGHIDDRGKWHSGPRPKFGGITPQKTMWYYAARREIPPVYGAGHVWSKYFNGPESIWEYLRDNWSDFDRGYFQGR